MSKLTKEQRDALPASDFGDPERRLFPIKDQDDVDSAAHLIGKAKSADAVKARILAIAKRKGLKPPEAWTAKNSAFSTGSLERTTADGQWVVRSGKLFETGDFPDKDFFLDPEEAWVAVETFQGADLDMEHTDTVLDGKLGRLERIWLTPEYEIWGEARIPRWLDDVLGDERKVSCTWTNEGTKELVGLALVKNPRITDAVLMSAFSVSEETGTEEQTAQTEEITMDPVTNPNPAEGQEEAQVRLAQMQAQLDQLAAQNSRLMAERRLTQAAAFADQLVNELKILPAEKDFVLALFAQAMEDDEKDAKPRGLATFGASKTQSTRTEAFKAMFAARPAREDLTQEQLPVSDKDKAAFSRDKSQPDPNAPMTEERRRQLLGSSAFGRMIAGQ